jgi:hypothetical protein
MSSLPKTIGFGAILLTASTSIRAWCRLVRVHFEYVHRGGVGTLYANFYWDYSWLGIAASVLLFGMLVAWHVRKSERLYEVTYYIGIWLLVAWFGVALVAMESCFGSYWSDPRGEHW